MHGGTGICTQIKRERERQTGGVPQTDAVQTQDKALQERLTRLAEPVLTHMARERCLINQTVEGTQTRKS